MSRTIRTARTRWVQASLVGCVLAGCEAAPPGEVEDPADVEASTKAADDALVALKADLAADPEFAATAGLTATSTLDEVSLTRQIIRVDELRAWAPGTPVGTLFHPIGVRLFMVLDGNQVVSALVMGKNTDGTWRVVSQGHAARAPRIAAARADSIAALGEPTSPMFIITVPTLYAEFISQRKGDALYLTPIHDVAGLVAGTPVKAVDVAKLLQTLPNQADSRTR